MVSIRVPALKLTTVDSTVKIEVSYHATFSPLERHLAALGFTYRERIDVIGVDPAGSTSGNLIAVITPLENIPVSDGASPLAVARSRTITRTRAQMQEDPIGDDDEIRCKISIDFIGMPKDVTSFTEEKILTG